MYAIIIAAVASRLLLPPVATISKYLILTGFAVGWVYTPLWSPLPSSNDVISPPTWTFLIL